ncbi:MAG TPA: NfeD family protein [Anaerolineales bacterium]|jgi:membrane-bound serine protease (ClpP class)|nr:NfeD family protein [Anaerolineales bacterium]
MDFLLDPNIAYLFLLGGVLLAMLSLASPGTGLLEIGALFCLALGGYAVYNLSFNWWALLLLGLSIVPFVYAIQKPGRELFLGLSILLLVIGSIFLFPRTENQATVNPVVAIVASGLVAGFLWIAVRKSLEATNARPTHDLAALVGQVGEARTKINEEGSVLVAGELWSARSEDPIPAGSSVRVLRREGFILIVEKNG